MLTAVEKEGFKRLLSKLSADEVHSLKETVTKKQIVTVGKSESIEAIITYTESAVDLLKRKKMKRDILFQYLVDSQVVVNVSAEKHQLIKKILNYWGSSFQNAEIEDSSSKDSLSSELHREPYQELGRECSAVQHEDRLYSYSLSPTDSHPSSSPLQQVPYRQDLSLQQNTTGNDLCVERPEDEKYALGKHFVDWFYKMLNSHNPSLQSVPDGEFGPQHFWQDSHLEMQFNVKGETTVERYEGAMLVSQRFLALVKEEQLLFNPNVTPEGIKVKSNAHGLVLVMTCGTLHRVNDCLGLFEQVFGLVSDPALDNNWKVKMSCLKMKSSQNTAMPKLENGDTTLEMALLNSR